MFEFFLNRKLFDISCTSDLVQPILKSLSVVLAECGHFVVTWSVQEYSCCYFVCTGILLHSPVSQQNGAQKQTRNFYIKFTFNSAIHVLHKCYEFKLNTELLKTCVNAMNTL